MFSRVASLSAKDSNKSRRVPPLLSPLCGEDGEAFPGEEASLRKLNMSNQNSEIKGTYMRQTLKEKLKGNPSFLSLLCLLSNYTNDPCCCLLPLEMTWGGRRGKVGMRGQPGRRGLINHGVWVLGFPISLLSVWRRTLPTLWWLVRYIGYVEVGTCL